MKKFPELLLNAKEKHSDITLYYPGLEFSGTLQDVTDEMIILTCNNQNIFLDRLSLIGLSQPLDIDIHKSFPLPNKADPLSAVKKIEAAGQPTASVIELIKSNVRDRVRNYQNIEKNVEEIICQMELLDGTGVDSELLSLLNNLQSKNQGCVSALRTLEAGLHYAGGNKEKAVDILWNTGRYEIALAIIGEIWDSQIYLDCLGYAVTDFDPDLFCSFESIFRYYVKCCAEQEDISLLTVIIENTPENIRRSGEGHLLKEALLYLIQKKNPEMAGETDENTRLSTLLQKAKQLYPNSDTLLQRQNCLEKLLEEHFSQTDVKIKTADIKMSSSDTDHTSEMHRSAYYIGTICDRFNTGSNYYQFRVTLDLYQSQEIYMHTYQIADPLLLHKLTTSKDCKGTKICFRFGHNDKGLCVADAVMTENERSSYREFLRSSPEEEYIMPDRFNYLHHEDNPEILLELFEKDLLEYAAKEAQKEHIDYVEWIIFIYNYIMNRNTWRNIGYPHIVTKLPELIEYLETTDFNTSNLGKVWADKLENILITTNHKDLAIIFQSMREGMSKSSPLHAKAMPDPRTQSREALLGEYIFPACNKGNYTDALEYIQYWKKMSMDTRKPPGRQWERVCILEKICGAALEKNSHLFARQITELSNILTETQKEKLSTLLHTVKENGGIQ